MHDVNNFRLLVSCCYSISYVPLSLCLLLALPSPRAHAHILLRHGKGTRASATVCINTQHLHWKFLDNSRDNRCPRDAGADNTSEREAPPDCTSHAILSTTSAVKHQEMSTLLPVEAGNDFAWTDSQQGPPLPNADRIPRSATGSLGASTYRNLNIDIPFPLNTQSSLSMELTHDGKVLELVTRFESFTSDHDSDASQAHHEQDSIRAQCSSSDSSLSCDQSVRYSSGALERHTVRASPGRTGRSKAAVLSNQDSPSRNTLKAIPSEWKKITRPQAPVFQTDLRQEARENKRRNPTYLTKDARGAVDNDIASASAPPSPTKLARHQSKTNFQSPASSSTRSSPRHSATVKINAATSPARSSRMSVQNQGREPSVAPSAVSNQGTEYHSAHSPVSLVPSRVVSERSSPESFFSADERIVELRSMGPSQERQFTGRRLFLESHSSSNSIPQLSLTSADGVEQSTAAQRVHSRLGPHSRSKTESHIAGPRIRPVATDLHLRIPASVTHSRSSKPPSGVGSAADPAHGLSVLANQSLSRIPRMTPTFDANTKSSSLRRSKSTKSFKESNKSAVSHYETVPRSQELRYVSFTYHNN